VSVANGATLEISSASGDAVTSANSSGTLQHDTSQSLFAVGAGIGGHNQLHLGDIGFSASTTLGEFENSAWSGETLSMSDGVRTAFAALLGQPMAASFAMMSDGAGGAMIADLSKAVLGQQILAHLGVNGASA
jgi:hypothetical protein